MLNLYKTIINDDNFIKYFNDDFNEPNVNDSDYVNWCQTGRRHNPKFYEILKHTKLMDCTAGFKRIINNNVVIVQNDSWKLWEAFFAGCCVIAVDLDLFNIKFPVQPRNMFHYILTRFSMPMCTIFSYKIMNKLNPCSFNYRNTLLHSSIF